MDPADPMRKALQLKQLYLMDGVDFDDIREYANKQLVLSGVREPETEEEIQMMEEFKNQGEEPSAEMILAQGEYMKGQAALMEEKRKGIEMQLDAQNEETKREIDSFEAMTQRMGVQVDAEEAGANIDFKRIDAFGKQIENAKDIIDLKKVTDEDLYQMIAA